MTTAACLADLGNEVCVIDIDQEKIRILRRHRLHFYEPGLQEVVERNARAGRLQFTTSYGDAEALGRSAAAFLLDARLRSEARSQGLKWAARFTWDAAARRTAEVYDRLRQPRETMPPN